MRSVSNQLRCALECMDGMSTAGKECVFTQFASFSRFSYV